MHTSYDSYDRSNVDVWIKSMKYAIYSLFIIEKAWILHASKKFLKKCSGTLLFTEQVTFEYELGNFVYDAIWLNMMYNLRKWCLKLFPCIVSHVNMLNTTKY